MTQPVAALRSEHLLLVEDDQFSQELIALYLGKAGFANVTVASDGRQALDLAKTTPFDLVLLDLNLPRISGTEVLRRLKKEGHLTDTPVVVISSLTNMEETVLCLDLGAEDYLPKPFNARLLEGRVNDCLERYRLRRQVKAIAAQTEREQEAARRLLQTMTAPVLPSPGASFPVHGTIGYDPGPVAGGDFVDLFAVPNTGPNAGVVAFVAGTATGEGLAAPLAAARLLTLLRQAVDHAIHGQGDLDPALILQRVNATFCAGLPEDAPEDGRARTSAAAVFGLFDPQTGVARLANANFAEILAVGPARGVTPVAAPSGRSLGLYAEAVYTTHSVTLEKREVLVALTDGFADTTDAAANRLGEQRLRKTLDALAGALPTQLVASLRKEVAGFAAVPTVDRSVLALSRVEG